MFNSYIQYLPTILLLAHLSNALYTKGDDVIELTDSNFDSKVLKSDGVWIVEFYSPNCGHCVSFAPAYKSAASALKGIVNVGSIDASKHSNLANKYNIKGYPTVKVFSHDKSTPIEYKGERSAASLIKDALSQVERVINKRTGKSGSDSSSNKSGGNAVVELTESNFDKLVLNSKDIWLIGFFAPWCGHCKSIKPEYESAAKQLKGSVKLGSVDATVHSNLAGKYNVRGYPTLYFFGADKQNPTTYDGGRTANDMVTYLKAKALAQLPPPKAEQLVKAEQLEVCKEKQLCVIAALPDLLDCQSKCRKNYIKMIETAGEKHKSSDWLYFWFAATVQPEVEKSFNLGGFGYPALLAMNQKKQRYASFRGSFSAEGIHEFLRDVSLGSRSISLHEISAAPKVVKTDPWDGKDGQMPDLEEINLDDLKDEL